MGQSTIQIRTSRRPQRREITTSKQTLPKIKNPYSLNLKLCIFREEESIRPAVPSDPLPNPQASDGGPEDSSEGETKTSSAVLTLAPPPPPQRRKKSSVIQQIRKFSTRKRQVRNTLGMKIECIVSH